MAVKGSRGLVGAAVAGCLVIGLGILLVAAATNDKGKVEFREQTALGQTVENGAEGQLKYNRSGPTFDFFFSATRLDKGVSYTLVLSREPDVTLPARYQAIATGVSDSGGVLVLTGSFKFHRDLLAGKFLLIPTDQPPDKPLTYQGKYLFATGTVAYDDTESNLICGSNQSPGPSDQLGFQAGDKAVDFSLFGIEGPASLTPANQGQPLVQFTLSKLLESKPVLLVNGAFT